jgi:hypothetical protein
MKRQTYLGPKPGTDRRSSLMSKHQGECMPYLEAALTSMRAALAQLDRTDAPADIGALLDLAITRLEVAMIQSGSDVMETESK